MTNKNNVKIKLSVLLKYNDFLEVSKFYHKILVGSGAVSTLINLLFKLSNKN